MSEHVAAHIALYAVPLSVVVGPHHHRAIFVETRIVLCPNRHSTMSLSTKKHIE